MKLQGRCHRFGDNVTTDDIIAGKYKNRILEVKDLARHLMENLDPEFHHKVGAGDFIVGGRNFGTGSSREAAPAVILAAGVRAVLAQSFARIFYRNSFNLGLLLLECDTEGIGQGDELLVDTDDGTIKNVSRGGKRPFQPPPPFFLKVLAEGGLVAHFKTHGGFSF
jgi:3-isopropylmalate/(R)-2-methylmalate dehydratase small subunit